MTRPARRRRRVCPRPRAGFTLVELLVVLVILAVLVALLLPAINGAVRRARGAAVQAEINGLAQALQDFKQKYGDFPPSRVILNESGVLPTGVTAPVASSASSDILVGALAQRTITAMRKFWPRAPFVTQGNASPIPGYPNAWYDFNGDAKTGPQNYVLQGHECLVFFLGGVPLNANGTVSMIGFGKSPTNPFSNGVVGSAMYSNNRNAPFYQFSSSQLQLTSNLISGYGGSQFVYSHGIPGYIDQLNGRGDGQSFYAYFSTNVGNGYDPNDENLAGDQDGNSTTPLWLAFYPGQLTFPNSTPPETDSPTPNPYTTGPAFGTGLQGAVAFHNPQSFQIISPGADGMYGLGGTYNPSAAQGSALPAPAKTNSTDTNVRTIENDNLTNFHNGTLQ